MGSRAFTTDFLIEWMVQHEVLATIWSPRKTHLQLVQRSDEVMKLLLKEGKLTIDLLEKFWSLAVGDFKSEVFKILNDVSFYLK